MFKKSPEQIQNKLLIINLGYYSINSSFNELADIIEKIRDMEPCAIKLALTFRTAKSQFEAECILLTKVKMLKLILKNMLW